MNSFKHPTYSAPKNPGYISWNYLLAVAKHVILNIDHAQNCTSCPDTLEGYDYGWTTIEDAAVTYKAHEQVESSDSL